MLMSGGWNVNGIGLTTHRCGISLCQRPVVETQYNDSPPTAAFTRASNSQLLTQMSNLGAQGSIDVAHLKTNTV